MSLKQFMRNRIFQAGSLMYANNDSKVIYYHDVHRNDAFTAMSTDMKLFDRHMRILEEEGYQIVDQIKNNKNEIQITFDDGFRGLYENFSYFVDNSIPITVFLISDFIGQKNYLNEHEIKEMLDSGLLKIGSHTCSHRNLDEMSSQEMISEVMDSKKCLEDRFDREMTSLCYPRGKFNDDIIEAVINASYTLQYSCLPGSYFDPFQPGVIKRSLMQHANPDEFRYILHGGDKIFYNRYFKQQYRK